MKYAFTLKLIEYMAAGLPVITTNVGDGAQIVKESNSGYIIDYSAESFSNAVINLIRDDDLRHSMSMNGTKYAKNFDWGGLASLEISALNNVIAEHSMKFK
jgi:glycosyltransferase involved in cell wall biosynthesis